jgi:hypothetical protein
MSTDSGDSWHNLNSGLTNNVVTSLAVDSLGYLYLGSIDAMKGIKGGGVFKTLLPGSDLGVRNIEGQQFDNSIFINVNNKSMLCPDDVQSVTIFDEIGNKKLSLKQAIGQMNIYDLLGSNGVYFVRFQTKDSQIIRKLLLVK